MAIRQAIASDEPIILLEHELLYFSKGDRDAVQSATDAPCHGAPAGRDLTIVSYSRMALLAQEAAAELAKEGIEAEVIDLRSLNPIDWDTCAKSVDKTHRLLIVEEDSQFGGVGGEIAATLGERCFYSLDAPINRVAGLDIPIAYNGALEAASRFRAFQTSWPPRAVFTGLPSKPPNRSIDHAAADYDAGLVGYHEQRPPG